MATQELEALRLQLLLKLVEAAGNVRPLMDNLCTVTLHMHSFDIADDVKVDDFMAKMANVMMACEDIGGLATELSTIVSAARTARKATKTASEAPTAPEAK